MLGRKFEEKMLFSKSLRQRLDAEAELQSDIGTPAPLWYAIKTLANGHAVIERNYNPGEEVLGIKGLNYDPVGAQIIWADGMARLLNKECHHDGAWVLAFTHPPDDAEMLKVNPQLQWRRLVKLWLDAEGDVQFTVDNIDPFWQIFSTSPHHYVEQSEQAWQEWKKIMRDAIDPAAHQLKPLAYLKERGHA